MAGGGRIAALRQGKKQGSAPSRTRPTFFLLAGHRLRLALAGARIGVRALAADGQALAMTPAAIAEEVHTTVDVHRSVAVPGAHARVVGVNRLAQLGD